MMGLHASFTLADETLAEVKRRLPPGVGCHIHIAEDALDIHHSRAAFGAGPLQRLDQYGLLGETTLLIHGVHLSADELRLAAKRGAVLVHNPESNANNGVGRLDLCDAADSGVTLGLGTDGMGSSMLRSGRAAFLMLRSGRRDPTTGFDVVPGMLLEANAAVASRFFDEPDLGKLRPGAPADIAVLDAPPPTPISPENVFGHLIYGANEAPVRHTIARGRVLLEDFDLTRLDLACIAAQAREATPALWERFRTLSARTPFPGGREEETG
jgi:cytosine/adenosine deaminase-related metal-dependent hydrolase